MDTLEYTGELEAALLDFFLKCWLEHSVLPSPRHTAKHLESRFGLELSEVEGAYLTLYRRGYVEPACGHWVWGKETRAVVSYTTQKPVRVATLDDHADFVAHGIWGGGGEPLVSLGPFLCGR